MASINKEDSNTIAGILYPVISHKFMLEFNDLRDIERETMKNQVIRCNLNMVNDTLIIVLEQPMANKYSNAMFEAIKQLARQEKSNVQINHLSSGEVESSFLYKGTLVDHEYILDYAEADTVKHILTFKDEDVFKKK